jgi:hypothetical protein
MKVFWCYFPDFEWGCFVIAETPGKAKSLFFEWYNWTDYCEYTEIRCFQEMKLPDCLALQPQVLDDPDDPLLKELGLKYAEVDG